MKRLVTEWPVVRVGRSVLLVLLLVPVFCLAENLPLAVKDRVEDQYGRQGLARIDKWERMMWDLVYKSQKEQLLAVNLFFNKLEFRSDLEHWQQEDYWATPIETLASNGGDCEDFAIAKYFSLRRLGVPAEQMRITYVKALELNEPHMVLTYYSDNGDPLVLDILTNRIKPAEQRKDLLPVYSFNAEGLWKGRHRNESVRLGDSNDIPMWRDLQQRLGMGPL